jgi:hypothetical protein
VACAITFRRHARTARAHACGGACGGACTATFLSPPRLVGAIARRAACGARGGARTVTFRRHLRAARGARGACAVTFRWRVRVAARNVLGGGAFRRRARGARGVSDGACLVTFRQCAAAAAHAAGGGACASTFSPVRPRSAQRATRAAARAPLRFVGSCARHAASTARAPSR